MIDQNPPLATKSVWTQFFAFLLLCFCSLAVSSFVGILLIKFFLGIEVMDISALMTNLADPAAKPALRILQITQAVGGFILPSLFFAQLTTGNALEVHGALTKPKWIELALGLMIILTLQPLINFMSEWNASLSFPKAMGIEQWMRESEERNAELIKLFLQMEGLGDLLITLLMIGVLAGLGEEFLFRGTLQPLLEKHLGNRHLAVFITAFLFSALHMQFYGFFPRFFLGIGLGYMLTWSGSIWVPVLVHTANNSLAVLLYYLIQHKLVDPSVEHIGTGDGFKAVVLSLLLSLFLLRHLYSRRSRWLD